MRMLANLPLKRAIGVATAGLLGVGVTALAFTYSPPGVTSYGWALHPAGKQIDLADGVWWADRPYGQGLSPDGRTLLISSAGASNESVKVVDTASGTVRQTIKYVAPEAVNVGVVWSPDGSHAYVSAGGNDKIRTYSFNGSTLTETGFIATVPTSSPTTPPPPKGLSYPMGLAISRDGATLYAAENRADALAVIDLATTSVKHVSVGTCSEQGGPVDFGGPQCQPYGVALSGDGATAYVSNWGEESVTPINTATLTADSKIRVGTHPSALLVNPKAQRHQLAVANSDSDTISLIDTRFNTVVGTVSLAPYANALQGSQPNALGFAPNGSTLYVANAGTNDVDVIALGANGSGSSLGRIPTAWYPSAIDVAPNGATLYIANAKGMGAGPNPGYQQGQFGPPAQYDGSMMHGTLQIVSTPDSRQLAAYTQQVASNNGSPRQVSGLAQIKHVIYVVKENRTYDQVFGSLGKGNGDPSLNLFGDESATNIRNLARRFVVLDNYYAVSEVSADGWSWSTEANANTYDQKAWPQNYSDVNRGRGYDFEGGNYATAANLNPKDSYIWDRFADKGVSYRNYGFFTQFGVCPPAVAAAPTAPNLATTTDPNYNGYNLSWPDSPLTTSVLKGQGCIGGSPATVTPRITEWQNDFAKYVANNNLPTVELVRLPNDHTRGTAPNAPTPKAYVADNDYALGLLVDTVSHSKYWKDTAIFVTEDDSQDGPDHVDGHRSEALVISPYTQTGRVDSTFYSTVSMLRTIELISGINPLTQFDAAAMPMLNSFSSDGNRRPYDAVVPPVLANGVPTNGAAAPMASAMSGLSLTQADNLPESVLNAAIWKSVKGQDSNPPGGGSAGD